MKNNNSDGMNGMHNSKRIPPNTIPLSRAYQIHIGDPNRKVSIGNPQGYSLSQRKQFKSFDFFDCYLSKSCATNYAKKRLLL